MRTSILVDMFRLNTHEVLLYGISMKLQIIH